MVYIHKLLDNLGILPTIILMLQMVKLIQDIYIARDLRLTQKTVKANKEDLNYLCNNTYVIISKNNDNDAT